MTILKSVTKHVVIKLACYLLPLQLLSQYSIDPRIRASSINIQSTMGSGSGFLLEDTLTKYLYIVTASHVIVPNNNANSILPDSIIITGYRDDVDVDSTYIFKVGIKECIQSGNLKADLQNDVAIIRFAKLENRNTYAAVQYPNFVRKLTRDTKIESWPSYLSVSIQDITPGSDLFVIGFPQSLGLQGNFDMNRPLMRKGIVAGKDLKLQRVIGDAAVYFGNSGGIAVAVHYSNNSLN